MSYTKPLMIVRDLAQESACCKDPNSCQYQSPQQPPPAQDPCGINVTNDGRGFTLSYNFGSDCFHFGWNP